MGLLSKLKLPQPPGGQSAGGVGGAVSKAGKMAQDAAKGVPKAPPKKGGIGGVVDAVQLAVRVQTADQQMNAALAAANNVGNPLNNRTSTTPEAPARKVWQAGMVKFWQPGSAARIQALSLQGEARIAKAQEATALLAQARAVFQQGLQSLG